MINCKIRHITIFVFLIVLNGCKKCKEPAKNEYTLKGRFENGTTMLPTRADEIITVFAKVVNGNGSDRLEEIGSFTTDAEARFEFRYKHQSQGESITLRDAFQGKFDDIPLNKNFEKEPWYVSSYGKLKLNYSFSNFNMSDTLYLGYSEYLGSGNFKQVIKSYTNISNDSCILLRVRRIKNFGIVWGINEQFTFSENNGEYRVIKYHELQETDIQGDPIIDELNLAN